MSRQRGLGVLFGLLALAALAAAAWFSPSSGVDVAGVDGWVSGISGIEEELAEKTTARLNALGVRDAAVTVEGRDVTVELPSGFPNDLDAPAVSAELMQTSGVRTVSFDATVPDATLDLSEPEREPEPTAEPTAVPETAPEPAPASDIAPNDIIARVDLGSLLLSGDLQTENQRAVILEQLDTEAVAVVDQMTVFGTESSPASDLNVQVAAIAVASLVEQAGSGSVRLSDDIVIVEASVADQQAADRVAEAVRSAGEEAGTRTQLRITVADPQPTEVVNALDLSGVNFQSGTSELAPDAFAILNEAAAALAGLTNVTIEVQGHTDDQGGADANQALSEARAAVVAEYLSSQGIDASIFQVRGYGEAEPIDDNQTEQGRAANRRVELVVIEGN